MTGRSASQTEARGPADAHAFTKPYEFLHISSRQNKNTLGRAGGSPRAAPSDPPGSLTLRPHQGRTGALAPRAPSPPAVRQARSQTPAVRQARDELPAVRQALFDPPAVPQGRSLLWEALRPPGGSAATAPLLPTPLAARHAAGGFRNPSGRGASVCHIARRRMPRKAGRMIWRRWRRQ